MTWMMTGFYLHFRKTTIFWLLSWEVLGGLGMSLGDLELFEKVTSSCTCPWATASTVAEEPDQTYTKFRPWKGSSFTMFHHVSPIQDPCQSSTEGSEGLKAGRDAASLQLPNPMTSSGSTSSDSQPSCPWGARQHDLDHLWINQIWVCMKMIEHVWKTTQFP